MELSDKKLNIFQKGIWQKIFSLAVYGVCIVAVTYAIDRLIQRDINNALASLQKKADLSERDIVGVLKGQKEKRRKIDGNGLRQIADIGGSDGMPSRKFHKNPSPQLCIMYI